MSPDLFNKEKSPTILVTGKNGQVGWELQRSLQSLGKVVAVNREHLNLSDSDNVREVIRKIQPDIIVNAAAYTAVDKAEEEQELAYQINAISPGVMAEEAKKISALLIHYSTDYVFNGQSNIAYTETDIPDPINIYGKSKLAGEKAIQDSGCDYLILRTSWVFSSRGHNFLLSMLKFSQEQERLKIVSDQIGSPTSANFIANATSQIICKTRTRHLQKEFPSGIYNLVSSGKTTWHGFASSIIETAQATISSLKIATKEILPIPTSEYPTPAKRPLNSLLSTERIQKEFGVYSPDWQEQMKLSIEEIKF